MFEEDRASRYGKLLSTSSPAPIPPCTSRRKVSPGRSSPSTLPATPAVACDDDYRHAIFATPDGDVQELFFTP